MEVLYISGVKFLTKQEQTVLCLVILLLLTGWAVKAWRTTHPGVSAVEAVRMERPAR